MGCFYTKAKPEQYSSNGTNQVHVLKPAGNGVSHFKSHNLLPKSDKSRTGTVDVVPKRRTMAPESSQSRVISPLDTCPRTPEEDRLSLSVQYAEDLEPVNNLPDVITVATMEPKTKKVSVSTLSLNSTSSKKQKIKPKVSNNDVSIEDLDTELDQYSKYRLVYDRPLRPLSETHLQRNKTFVVELGGTRYDRPKSDYVTMTRPSL